MSIIDKMAEAIAKEINAGGKINADNVTAAHAAWDIVKAEMLGDDTVKTMLIAFMFNLEIGAEDVEAISNAMAAVVKKLEE